MTSINSSSSTPNLNVKKDSNYLKKKTKRRNFVDNHIENKFLKKQKRKDYGLVSPLQNKKKVKGSKSVIRQIKNQKHLQPRINDYFEKPNSKAQNIENNLYQKKTSNSNDSETFTPDDNYNPKNYPKNKNKIQKKQELFPKKLIKVRKNNDYDSICSSSSDKYISINPFSQFSNIINNLKDDNKSKININYLINNGIFNKSEINLAIEIQKEFNQEINSLSSEIDQLIKTTIFFINKGFNEEIRYNFYKCLINYGFPTIDNFNTFHDNFISDCEKIKIDIPDKMLLEFYIEYISNLLLNEKMSRAEKKIIEEFFFNGENIDVIINNLNLINNIKENKENLRSYMQEYLELSYNEIFKDIDIKLNKDFPKSKTIICKMISNIVYECDKSGFVNYKKLISNDDVLFDGLKIKGGPNIQINLRKMISLKIFGQELPDKKFNNVLVEYLLQLFSNFKN